MSKKFIGWEVGCVYVSVLLHLLLINGLSVKKEHYYHACVMAYLQLVWM